MIYKKYLALPWLSDSLGCPCDLINYKTLGEINEYEVNCKGMQKFINSALKAIRFLSFLEDI